MGEAARRAKTDSTFGRIPKAVKEQRRGIVVSPPVNITKEGGISLMGGGLHPQELRSSLLFFDDLVLPQNNIITQGLGQDENFLIEAGVLKVHLMRMRISGTVDGIKAFADLHLQAFKDLDALNPGRWSLATGENSFNWDNLPEGTADGYRLELMKALPVPNEEVPLAEVLEFKLKRRSEIFALRAEIDSFGAKVAASADVEAELQASASYIEKACSDLLKTGKEWKFPIRIADAKCSFEFNVGQVAGAAGLGLWAGQSFAMPAVGALIGGALSFIKVTGDFKLQPVAPRSSPYQYVYSFHNELY